DAGGAAGADVGQRDGVGDGVALVGRGGPGDADRQVSIRAGIDDRGGGRGGGGARVGVGGLGADGRLVGGGGPAGQVAGDGHHQAEGVGAAGGDVGVGGLGDAAAGLPEGEGVGAARLRHGHEGRAGRQGVGQDEPLGGVGSLVGERDGVRGG